MRAQARIAATIRERAGERMADRRGKDYPRGREQHEVVEWRTARRRRAPKIRRIEGLRRAMKGESKVRRDAGLKSTTRHGDNLQGELLPRHPPNHAKPKPESDGGLPGRTRAHLRSQEKEFDDELQRCSYSQAVSRGDKRLGFAVRPDLG